MEHRCSVRKSLRFQVLLYKHGLPVLGGTCRNLGLGGVFVETRGYVWGRNEYMSIEFIAGDGRPLVKLPAVVVHHSAHGAGLMFDAVSQEQRRSLRVLLSKLMTTDATACVKSATPGPRAVA